MSGSSPLRNGLSLAQRFAYKPGDSTAASVVASASKRRKLAGPSSDATISTSAAVSIAENGDRTTTLVQQVACEAVAPAGSSANVAENGHATSVDKGKKRALTPEESQDASLSNDIARNFVAGLSEKEIAGVGGSLSEKQLLALESETMHPSWLQALSKEYV